MDRYERILTLHRLLRTARYPVAFDHLKEELRCSRATLYRDIAFLRDALGAPIEMDGERHAVGYDREQGERFELPGLWLTSEELAALLAVHQMLIRTGPGVLASALAPLRQRIERLLSNQESGRRFDLNRIRVTVIKDPKGRGITPRGTQQLGVRTRINTHRLLLNTCRRLSRRYTRVAGAS